MEKKITVIGCGYWGKNLVRNFHALGALSVVCESDQVRHDDIKKTAPGAKITAS